ncbi:uncharacterized protein V6R79_022495 [Siganus canaliculatus]
MMFFFLLLSGNFAPRVALPEINNRIDQTLVCTNDFDKWISCDFEAPKCAEYNVTLLNKSTGRSQPCIKRLCDNGRCCCSLNLPFIIHGQSHEATVWRGGRKVVSKVFSVRTSVKPKQPKNISVKESNGNFQVCWEFNMPDVIHDDLEAIVTYGIKGHLNYSTKLKPPTINGRECYEIPGTDLLPKTVYVVSVQTRSEWSELLSDRIEVEFTTPESWTVVLVAVIVSLSVAAVIISVVTYFCYIKLKTKWWDSAAKCENPKPLDIRPGKQEILKPMVPDICPVRIEPFVPDDSKPWSKVSLNDSSGGSLEQSSGISSGSSCLSYANTEPADIIAGVQDALSKAFASINLAKPTTALTASPLTELNSALLSAPDNLLDVRAVSVSPGSSSFDNETYSILLPSLPHQIEAIEPEVKAEMICDSAYHPSEGNTMSYGDQQGPACPLVCFPPAVSSFMPTDMSYQQCQAVTGSFSYGEDCSLTSGSSGTNTAASCDLISRVDEYESYADATDPCRNAKIDENPCYGCLPVASFSFPPVDNDYQAFENLVEQSNIQFSEKNAGEDGETLNKYPEQIPVVSGMLSNTQGGQCLPELHRPFLSVLPANQSVITDTDYQRV